MNFVAANIKWIMLVSGALDLHDGLRRHRAASRPSLDLRRDAGGSARRDRRAQLGRADHAGGRDADLRRLQPRRCARFALAVAGASKLVFIALVLSHGGRYLGQQAGIAIAIDLVWVVLFALYLLGARTARA